MPTPKTTRESARAPPVSLLGITVYYESADDFAVGKSKSQELEIEAIQPHRRHHDLLYCIHLNANDQLLLNFAEWPGNEVEGEGEQIETGDIDGDAGRAIWPTR